MNIQTNRVVQVEGLGAVHLTDRDFRAAGGEAGVYQKDDLALKIYHQPQQMLAPPKIDELRQIQNRNVLLPQSLVYDERGQMPIGFTMSYVSDAQPLVKLFSKVFKQRHHLQTNDLVELIYRMQSIIEDIHLASCLVVDLNEMNILIGKDFDTAWFIDVDSFQSPSYPATALLPAIMDPLANGIFTPESDWFSFAILCFQLYTGLHPYKGKHPNYRPDQLVERMQDGISVFDGDVLLPPNCPSFETIPGQHLSWFQALFKDNQRLPPPDRAGTQLNVAATQTISADNTLLHKTLLYQFSDPVLHVQSLAGGLYVVTTRGLYRDGTHVANLCSVPQAMVESSEGEIILAYQEQGQIRFQNCEGTIIDTVQGDAVFSANGRMFTLDALGLNEHEFSRLGPIMLRKHRGRTGVTGFARAFDGVVISQPLGRHWITMSTEKGIFQAPCTQLDGHRVVAARGHGHFCLVISEKAGDWYRHRLNLESGKIKGQWEAHDYSEPDFAQVPSGPVVMISGADLLVFAGQKEQRFDNPPLDGGHGLFVHRGEIHFIHRERIFKLSNRRH